MDHRGRGGGAEPHFDAIVSSNVQLLQADACLWEGSPARLADGRPGLGLGFKGALAIRLDLRLLATDAHSATAAIVPSAAWRLVQALSTLRSPDGSILIDGFYDDVLATSKAEHAAIAEAGDAFEEGIRQALEIEAFIDDLKGAELRERASFAPTCNIAGIKTGYSGPGTKTVLPAEANAWLDLRLVPDQRPEKRSSSSGGISSGKASPTSRST